MKQEGYSPSYADKAGVIHTTEWDRLMADYLPDEDLMDHHKRLLNAVAIDHYIFPKSESDDSIYETIEGFGFQVLKIKKQGNWKRVYFPIMNAKAKKDALDMAYKLKKKYDTTINIKHGFESQTDADLERELAGIISEVSEGLANIKRTRKPKGK